MDPTLTPAADDIYSSVSIVEPAGRAVTQEPSILKPPGPNPGGFFISKTVEPEFS